MSTPDYVKMGRDAQEPRVVREARALCAETYQNSERYPRTETRFTEDEEEFIAKLIERERALTAALEAIKDDVFRDGRVSGRSQRDGEAALSLHSEL